MDDILTFRMLDDCIRSRGDAVYGCFKDNSVWQPVSWREFREAYLKTAALLRELHGDVRPTVAVLAGPSVQWNMCDFATLAVGGVVVGLYPHDRDEVLRHALSTSKPTTLVVEDMAALERIAGLDPQLTRACHVIVIHGDNVQAAGRHLCRSVHSFAQNVQRTLCAKEQDALRLGIDALEPEQPASHVYTSGTTGLPKAAVLLQRNLMHTAKVYARCYPVTSEDRTLLFLPFAHVFSRVMYYSGIIWGVQLYYSKSIADVATDIRDVEPTVLLVVPRMLEKVRSLALAKAQAARWPLGWLFRWALRVGSGYHRHAAPGPLWRLVYHIAGWFGLGKLRRSFGSRLRFIGCGGGKLPDYVSSFFASFGTPVYEGYATTESGGLGVFSLPGHSRPGCVGKPVPEINVRFEEDGEICVRSHSVFSGYLGDEAGTREVLRDGWLHTGDIGAYDDDGYLRVIDRKKDILTTSYGKKVAPSWVEAKLVEQSEVEDAVVFGDARPFLVALVVPAADSANQPPALTAQDGRLRGAIAAVNEELGRHERIKRFQAVPAFALNANAMTSTLKKRREVIFRMYEKDILAMYAEANEGGLPPVDAPEGAQFVEVAQPKVGQRGV